MTQISAYIHFTYVFHSSFSCSYPKINTGTREQIWSFSATPAATPLKRRQWQWEGERRKSMSLIPSISFISAGGCGGLRQQRVGWWCDLAGLSVISGTAILAPLFGLGYNVMWCPGPSGAALLLLPASLIKICSQPASLSLDALTLPSHFHPASCSFHIPSYLMFQRRAILRDKFRPDTSHAFTCTVWEKNNSYVVERKNTDK